MIASFLAGVESSANTHTLALLEQVRASLVGGFVVGTSAATREAALGASAATLTVTFFPAPHETASGRTESRSACHGPRRDWQTRRLSYNQDRLGAFRGYSPDRGRGNGLSRPTRARPPRGEVATTANGCAERFAVSGHWT